MIKSRCFFLMPVLLIVALLLAGSGGVLAKQDPGPVPPVETKGAPTGGEMVFYKGAEECTTPDQQAVKFVGHCKGVKFNSFVCYEWAQENTPALMETDLVCGKKDCPDEPHNAEFNVPNEPLGNSLLEGLKECYGLEVDAIRMQFKSVRNFLELEENELYSADVMMQRMTPIAP